MIDEDYLCNTEDGACRFSSAMQDVQAEVERLQAKIAEDALTIGALRDELALERTKLAACAVVAQGGSYEGTHPAAVSHALDEVHALRQRLEWFEAREPSVLRLRDTLHSIVASEWSKEAANDECAFFDDWESIAYKLKPEGGALAVDDSAQGEVVETPPTSAEWAQRVIDRFPLTAKEFFVIDTDGEGNGPEGGK